MNWLFLIFFGIAVVVIIVFLIRHNKQDKKAFEKQLNQDYHKPKKEEGDIDAEDITN